MIHEVMPLISTIACGVFAVMVLQQFRERRKPYQLAWGLGLLTYGIGTATEFLGYTFGWNATLYRWWYLGGAIATAATLGLGEVYLLRATRFGYLVALGVFLGALPAFFSGLALGRQGNPAAGAVVAIAVNGIIAALAIAIAQRTQPHIVGHVTAVVLAVGLAIAASRVLSAPIDMTVMFDPETGVVVGRGFPEEVRLLTPMFNIAGAGALILGALYSAWVFWRERAMPRRAVSNVIIAIGAFVPTLTSTLNRFGVTEAFFVGELLGVVLIFIGFLVSTEIFATVRSRRLNTWLGRVTVS